MKGGGTALPTMRAAAADLRWPGLFRSRYREARFLLSTHAARQHQLRLIAIVGALAYGLSIIPELGQPWPALWRWQVLPRAIVITYCILLSLVPRLLSRPDRLSKAAFTLSLLVACSFCVTMSMSPIPLHTIAVVLIALILVLILFIPLDPRWGVLPAMVVPTVVMFTRATPLSGHSYADIAIAQALTVVLAVALATRLRVAERHQFASLRSEVRARRRAESATAELRRLFETTPAPMVVVSTEEGLILQANDEFLRIFEVPPDPPEPLTGARFYRDPDQRTLMRENMELHGRAEIAMKAQTYLGKPLDGILSAYPIEYEGRPARIAIFRDTTQQRRTEEALRDAKEQAEAASLLKTQFLAHMSHEIRTPMNGVLGMAWLLEAGELTPDQQELVSTMRRSGEGLLRIIDDILDITKVEAGELTLRKRPFDLPSLVESVRAPLHVKAEQQGLRFEITAAPEVPSGLIGDEGRLAQIIINLAGNAIKFTDTGAVTVHLSGGAPTSSNDFMLRVDVVDTGIGIATKDLPGLFVPFVQADASHTRPYGGTGLGLAISRRLVELMGGRVEAESTLGAGSHFWFEVPLQPCAVPSTAAAPTAPVPLAETLRVLVAEDNPVNQLVARRMLERLGVTPSIVSDGQRAIEALTAESFDMVLMDVQMPEVDGLQATRWFREHEAQQKLPHTPVVAMTAHALSGDRGRCLASGMDDYVTKPLSLDQLREVLVRWTKAPPPAAA